MELLLVNICLKDVDQQEHDFVSESGFESKAVRLTRLASMSSHLARCFVL